MKKILVILATVASLVACQNNTNKKSEISNKMNTNISEIPFVVAKNYFVNSSFRQLDNPKIETAEKFNEIFGMATTMGESGKPTEINFSKQYVIAIIKPETDLNTSIKPESLVKNKQNEIVFTYKYITGVKQSFTTRPNFIIIVDKSEKGDIILNEIK